MTYPIHFPGQKTQIIGGANSIEIPATPAHIWGGQVNSGSKQCNQKGRCKYLLRVYMFCWDIFFRIILSVISLLDRMILTKTYSHFCSPLPLPGWNHPQQQKCDWRGGVKWQCNQSISKGRYFSPCKFLYFAFSSNQSCWVIFSWDPQALLEAVE